MKITKEIRTGLLIAIALTVLILGYGWLKGADFLNKGSYYTIHYDDAFGLQKGDKVLIVGYEVGKVQDIILRDNNMGVKILLSITEDIDIPVDSRAIIGGDFLGEKYVKLELGKSQEIANKETILAGGVEADVQSEIKVLSGKINTMITSIDTTINVLGSIFTENLKEDFAKSITGIKNTLESFNKSAARFNDLLAREEPRIKEIISNVSSTTDYVSESEGNVKAILENLKSLSDTLNSIQWEELSVQLDKAVENITTLSEKINSGQGSLGMIVNDKNLYLELTQTIATLDSVLTQFSANPEIKVSLFGGKNKKDDE
ncbi:MAG: MlaD family protein [Chitinophagales bacterium]